LFTFYFTLF